MAELGNLIRFSFSGVTQAETPVLNWRAEARFRVGGVWTQDTVAEGSITVAEIRVWSEWFSNIKKNRKSNGDSVWRLWTPIA